MVAVLISTHEVDWDKSRCRGYDGDPEDFFPIDVERLTCPAPMTTYCNLCPIRADCLTWALKTHAHGIWGGTSDWDRAQLRRPRARPRCPDCTSPDIMLREDVRIGICLGCALSWRI